MNSTDLQTLLSDVLLNLYDTKEQDIQLDIPDPKFGDVSTNIALKIAKNISKNPREIAENICQELNKNPSIKQAEVAGAGFINIWWDDSVLWELANKDISKVYQDQSIVIEYSDPNAFKDLHAGHFYTTIVGDVISRFIELAGASVHRVNFGGDVGLHAAKAMWGIIKNLDGENPDKLADIAEDQRTEFLSKCYVEGNTAYSEDKTAEAEITEINQKIYNIHSEDDKTSNFARIYWQCRAWSYAGFQNLYTRLEIRDFEKYYPESLTAPFGVEAVKRGLAEGIFEQSDGAVVFRGEKVGLHTRVFLNNKGLPTYEAKDLGLAELKWQDYKYDQNIIITGNDIIEYMKVVVAALKDLIPETDGRTKHITHGMIRMKGGLKMSSRLGNTLQAMDVLNAAQAAVTSAQGEQPSWLYIGAIKYSFLRQRIGGDIVYDPEESVSLEGNSGPYLMYAHARARSILAKAGNQSGVVEIDDLQEDERKLLQQLSKYIGVLDKTILELSPHHLCNYLYETSQVFNRFYENNKVIGDQRQALRLELVSRYADILKSGLDLLGIHAPDSM
jgi:arginyl-tRNA synthetase